MTKKIQENSVIYECLEKIVNEVRIKLDELSKANYFSSMRKNLDLSNLKEFHTIKICGSRQMGHTTSIKKSIERSLFNSIMVITYNEAMKKMNFSNTNNIYSFSVRSNTILGFSENVDAIFVDTASLFSKSQIDQVYDIAKHLYKLNKKLLVIFME